MQKRDRPTAGSLGERETRSYDVVRRTEELASAKSETGRVSAAGRNREVEGRECHATRQAVEEREESGAKGVGGVDRVAW